MSLKKKLKKLGKKVKKAAKSVGKKVGTVLRAAAPVAPFLIGGIPGIAVGAGAAISGSALKGGSRKKKLKALKRTGTQVAAVGAGTAALGLISGTGAGASGLASFSQIFSPSAEKKASGGLEDAFLDGSGAQSSGGVAGALSDAFLGSPGGTPGGTSPGSPGTDGTFEGRNEDLSNANSGEGSSAFGESGESKLPLVAAVVGVVFVGGLLLS